MSGGRVWLTAMHSRKSARRFAAIRGVTSRNLQMPFRFLTQLLSIPIQMRLAMERSRADDTSHAPVNNSRLMSPACDVDVIGCNAHIDTNSMFRGANLSLPYPTIVWKWLISKWNLSCPWEWMCTNTTSTEFPVLPMSFFELYPTVDDDNATDLHLDCGGEERTFPQDETQALPLGSLDSNKSTSITAALVTLTDAVVTKPNAPTPPSLPNTDAAEGFDTCSNNNIERRKRFEEAFLSALNETYWKLGAPLAKDLVDSANQLSTFHENKRSDSKTDNNLDRLCRSRNTYLNTHLIMPIQLTVWKWLMKGWNTPPFTTALYPLVMPRLRGKKLNVQQQSASLISFVFYITVFAFKQCSAPDDEYWRDEHHPKREVVHQALDSVVPTSSIVVFTEIDGGPLRDMQETLKLQYGFDNHAVEMRLAETSVTPNKRTEALTHSSRGHNLVAWDKAMFRLICVNDLTLKRWTFPGVVLQHRLTGEVLWVVGVHLTPRREHRALLKELDTVGRHCLHDNVRDRVAGIIAVGDLNVQYTKSFGKARMEDKRYLWSVEDRRTEQKDRTKLTNRRIKLKRQAQRRTSKRCMWTFENCCTVVKNRTNLTKRVSALGAFFASFGGKAPARGSKFSLNSWKTMKLDKRFRALMRGTDHRYPLRLAATVQLEAFANFRWVGVRLR